MVQESSPDRAAATHQVLLLTKLTVCQVSALGVAPASPHPQLALSPLAMEVAMEAAMEAALEAAMEAAWGAAEDSSSPAPWTRAPCT